MLGGVVLTGAWVGAAAAIRSEVTVRTSAPVCTGTDLVRADFTNTPYDGRGTPAIRLRPGMRCTVTATVRNAGPVAVRVTGVLVPTMGPEARAAAQVRTMDRRRVRSLADGTGDRFDALFARDDRVPAGRSVRFTLTYEYRPSGCDKGGILWLHDAPTVVVSALGKRGQVASPGVVAFRSTTQSDHSPGCRALEEAA